MSMYLVVGFGEGGCLGKTMGETHLSLRSAKKAYEEMKRKKWVRFAYMGKIMESYPSPID